MNEAHQQRIDVLGRIHAEQQLHGLEPVITHAADGVTVTEWHSPVTANSDGSDPQIRPPPSLWRRLTNYLKST